jgi:tetratricopeptide (TPR) repeat protein
MSGTTHSTDPAAQLRKGHAARQQNRLEDAKAAYTRAVNLARNAGDTALLAESVMYLGKIERDLGETDLSLQHYQEAAALIRTLPQTEQSPLILAHTIRHIADVLRESGQPAAAAPYYDEALILYRRHPNAQTLDLANTLRGLALLKTDLGDREAAITLWQEAGALYNQVWQEPGSPYKEADLAPGIAESQRQVALLSSR